MPAQWGVLGYPTTFLLDRNGVIRYRDLRGEAAVGQAVEKLLAEEKEPTPGP